MLQNLSTLQEVVEPISLHQINKVAETETEFKVKLQKKPKKA